LGDFWIILFYCRGNSFLEFTALFTDNIPPARQNLIHSLLWTDVGGEAKWMQHFMKSPNKLTKGIPIKQIQTTQGLFSVLHLLEGLRAKL